MKVFISGDTYHASDVHDDFYTRHVIISDNKIYCIIESKIMKYAFFVLSGTEGETMFTSSKSGTFLDIFGNNIIIRIQEGDDKFTLKLPITDFPRVYHIEDIIIPNDDTRTKMSNLSEEYFG